MNSASTSTASLLPSKQSPSSKKDYQKAFGKLSSSLGFGGSMPPVSTTSATTPNTSSRQSRASSQPSNNAVQWQGQAAYWASQSHKNFEAALGDLSSSHGFAGNAPSLGSKK
ncbi:hypothetical protein AGABI2DRAFT_195217 [Agaricus bisporus var. bisporus H97]|uniref:hypothetical protein n=1 Tax=Agaricus bisporus var. bisporus (strain H97 / ATCC MYA-4626 / FGSC 10389) TaxID=936046 RepID=UPI00029F6539|nr:hypothetical protein AGABI2DRAFT_195217 [Agaricus bisporus var. bisporus H97]EKV43685.1 hypothetical protein AGABI2DRAFT_195217 [Agaricus bisporus var. bisporus H97]